MFNWMFRRHLEDDETLVRIVHKHWLLGIKTLFAPTAVGTVIGLILASVQTQAVFLIAAVLGVVTVIWWIRNFLDYYLDAWIITDQGIIDIAWHGWFHRQSSRILYTDIQGVSYEIHGVFGTLLRYGVISVEKISSGEEIALENVSMPRRVESLILQAMEQYLHSKNLKDSGHIKDILASMIAQQIALQEMGVEEEEEDEEEVER